MAVFISRLLILLNFTSLSEPEPSKEVRLRLQLRIPAFEFNIS